MTALALRDDQTQWDAQQIAVLEAGGIDGDVSDAELAAFLHECQRRKLDPFTRQIYLIGRYDSRKGRKVYRSQTSIDGFRLIARRAADKSGIDYSYEDTIWFDESGQRHEIWLSDKPPAGAKVVVIRNGSRFDAVARFGAYVQMDRNGNPTGQWRNMADVMVAKCAEALALRKAFPEDLGGIYTEEEMAQADNPQRVTATAEVIRDEPAHEEQVVTTDAEWLAATERIIPQVGLDACRKLWRETFDKKRNGEITGPDSVKVLDLLKVRMEALASPQQDGETPPAESEAAPVAAVLDSEDPWAVAIRELIDSGAAEQLLADAADQAERGELDLDRAALIRQSVEELFPGITTTEAEAA